MSYDKNFIIRTLYIFNFIHHEMVAHKKKKKNNTNIINNTADNKTE